MYGLSVAAFFAVAIGMTGQIPLSAAESWETSNGLFAPAGTISGKIYQDPISSSANAITISATQVDLSLATWNGFQADNFFGSGVNQVQELSTTNNEFKAFAVQMSAESPNQGHSVNNPSTTVDLTLATWNGFQADNFFGTGLN